MCDHSLYLSWMKNQRGHWACWMSTSRKNGFMWRTHTHKYFVRVLVYLVYIRVRVLLTWYTNTKISFCFKPHVVYWQFGMEYLNKINKYRSLYLRSTPEDIQVPGTSFLMTISRIYDTNTRSALELSRIYDTSTSSALELVWISTCLRRWHGQLLAMQSTGCLLYTSDAADE